MDEDSQERYSPNGHAGARLARRSALRGWLIGIAGFAVVAVSGSAGYGLHAWWADTHHCAKVLGREACGADRYWPILPGAF